jgi:imidazolonepropionase
MSQGAPHSAAAGNQTHLRGLVVERLITCDEARSTKDNPLGALTDVAIVWDDTQIVFIGPKDEAPSGAALESHPGCVVTPGLVDAHTHAAWAGSRHHEYALRMAGADYRAIAAAGGGILSTQRAVAASTHDELAQMLEARLRRMASLGVTSVEVKSGYGLEAEHEIKQLEVIRTLGAKSDLPHLVPTFLALHAIPESAKATRDLYILKIATQFVRQIAAADLAAFVDAYVDQNAFSVEEARLVCESARSAGLGLRLHVGQFHDVGGAALAAQLGARTVDHLENVSDAAIAALAKANVAAVLLPLASFTLGQAPPPVARLRAAGIKLIVASDANPGTAPTESLPLAMAMAVRMYGLHPDEAILGATRHAGASLSVPRNGPKPRGQLMVGGHADLVLWNLPHEHAIVQPWGVSMTRKVWRDGVCIANAQPS